MQSVPLNMQPNIYNTEKNAFSERTRLQKLLKVGAVLPFTQRDPFLEVSEGISKHLGCNGAISVVIRSFSCSTDSTGVRKTQFLKITPQEVVWETKV